MSAEMDRIAPVAKNRFHPGAFALFPFSLVPFVALATYDWRSMPFLQTPSAPSANWIGVLGDYFAYFGYGIFGLAIWIVPAFCIASSLRSIRSGILARKSWAKRLAWRLTMMTATASLLQLVQGHAPGMDSLLGRLNLMAAGGATGYMIMEKGLAELLGPAGAGMAALAALAVSTTFAIGTDSIAWFFTTLWNWATGRNAASEDPEEEKRLNALEAAKDEVKRQREEAKRAEKERKLAEKLQREALKEAAWREAQAQAAEQKNENDKPADQKSATPEEPAGPENTADAESPAPQQRPQPDKRPYILPPADLLNPLSTEKADHGDTVANGDKIIETLALFGVNATIKYTIEGPVVTKFAVFPEPGTRYSAITSISDNLKGALCAKSIRIETPIPGENCIGIEIPNPKPVSVSFREVFESEAWQKSKAEVPLLFGKDVAGNALIEDLAKLPHLLVAGATGMGKSVCLNSIISGFLMSRTPDQLKLIMVDPKSVEFTQYANIPHLITPVITDNNHVLFTLNWVVAQMESRLKMFQRHRVRNIADYNKRKVETQTELFGGENCEGGDPRTVPYIVVIIDELADLMLTNAKEVTPFIARIAAKARAAGIHLILATQRPDTKVINGTIKSNIPGRLAFKTSQSIDSRTILDDPGAEELVGRGDMLFKGKSGNQVLRAQGAWISDEEIDRITAFIAEHCGTQFDERLTSKLSHVKAATVEDPFATGEDGEEDPVADQATAAQRRMAAKAAIEEEEIRKAIECIINTHRASTSHFQRVLAWGYNHATKILDKLADMGVVSQLNGIGPRRILMDHDQLTALLSGESASQGGETPGEGTGDGETQTDGGDSADEAGGAEDDFDTFDTGNEEAT